MERYDFVVDAMLGDLAKWLRILGKSVYYDPHAIDEHLIELARRCNAALLTRDRGLFERALKNDVDAVFIGKLSLEEALSLLARMRGVRLTVDLADTRCPLCNGKLKKVGKHEVRELVPSSVVDRYTVFLKCVKCGHVYWPGSHLRRMEEFLSEVRSKAFSASPPSGLGGREAGGSN